MAGAKTPRKLANIGDKTDESTRRKAAQKRRRRR
jgi:hypothetical protein